MATVFIPPTSDDVGRVVPWPHPGNSLFRFYKPFARGVSVYLLDDGSFTETQPPNNVGVAHTYHGGHEHPVTDAEAAALTAAGYGSRLVTVADVVPVSGFAAPTPNINPGGYVPSGSAYTG